MMDLTLATDKHQKRAYIKINFDTKIYDPYVYANISAL